MNSKLNVFTIVNSLYRSNTYILSASSDVDNGVWIVDLGDTDRLADCLAENMVLRGILLTHTHYDHIYGINDALRLFPDIRIITTEFGKQALCSPKLNYSRYHLNVEILYVINPKISKCFTMVMSFILLMSKRFMYTRFQVTTKVV
ncbi:hydroxyacylglutathione hydrolase [Bacteroides heparinolyticus]|uniref:Hydroxyacylglutathione hydrolase n=1 Tax=Prevotella heparinolytica TaxID=28113 RepID=A0A449I7R1_9BACE|nr:hydroxyacylglutathione hydrolase [Bacteroides heparinolyticus]